MNKLLNVLKRIAHLPIDLIMSIKNAIVNITLSIKNMAVKAFYAIIHWRPTVYEIILIVTFLGLVAATVFHTQSHALFVKSAIEVKDSAVYYFQNIITWEEEVPKDKISFLVFDETIVKSILPINFESFGYSFLAVFELLVNPSNISSSWGTFILFSSKLLTILMLMAMPFIIFYIVFVNFFLFHTNNNKPDDKSKPLRIYLWLKEHIDDHVKGFLGNLYRTFRYTKWIFWSYLLLLLYNINIMSFVMIFLAWYMYFIWSTDFVALWYLVCKFLICISPLLHPVFVPGWIFLGIYIIYRIKIAIAYGELYKMYDKNDKFVSELGIITGIYGVPGAGKNLLEVGIATQKVKLLIEQALDLMFEIRHEFPDFPFRYIEEEVERLKTQNILFNKVQIEKHFTKLFKTRFIDDIYGYSLIDNKNVHYDHLKVRTIQDELIDYAQLYFISISDLAASTYSLRYDIPVYLRATFPNYVSKYDIFHRDFRDDHDSEYAKIFDLNLIRLYQQSNQYDAELGITEKDKITLFDFGVLTLSEFGKERGNRYTNNISGRDMKDVSPAKDGTANCFGVLRHLTTVRHKQFGFIIWDDQNISSMSGKESAMAETNVFINKQKKEVKNTIPLFWIEEVIIQWALEHYNKQKSKYIAIRNDETLYSYFINHRGSHYSNLVRRIINTFGYRKVNLSTSGVNINGAQEKRDKEGESNTFYLMNKIIYSNRYKTDCYSGFFKNLKLQATSGINQFPSFHDISASEKELFLTNGYFAGELIDSIKNYMRMNMDQNKKEDETK